MKNMYTKSKGLIKNNKWWSLLILVVVLISGFYYFLATKPVKLETVQVKKGKIVEEVSVTGKVKPTGIADMRFERSGTVDGVFVEVGAKVQKGEVMVSLSSSDAEAQYRQAQAALKKESARLAELKAGTRPEEITLQENTVSRSDTSLREAVRSYIDTAKDTFAKVDDAVRGKADLMFTNPRGDNPQLNFSADFVLKIDLEKSRTKLEELLVQGMPKSGSLNADSIYLACLTNTNCSLDKYYDNLLAESSVFFEKLSLAVNSLTANSGLSQTTIDTWKSNVSIARTSVNNSTISLSGASEKARTAAASLAIEKDRLTIDKSGSTKETLLGQQASVEQAEANLSSAAAQLEKYYLRAPFSGLVAKQEAKIGQLVGPTDVVVSVISVGQFEMEAYVPEADIAKIAVNNRADVTLDAYGSDTVFPAFVYSIDPAETIIDNVSTYKIRLRFDKEDDKIKSGMTANINIVTATRENVLILPMRAITTNNNNEKTVSTVSEKDDNITKEIVIKTGLRGSDGTVEILSGVSEGDSVVSQTK